ncbi:MULTISPECIES: outer membrane protein assembly factor BamB [unclassified Polynucleobacter]|jgi:outer membrane protein assembly factor BamB|uniref:outer membrane protein assembly factor BamB n=1 Tax=unclassified Polynucleobacter TaxID=2640945 RepID=UPI001BFD5BE4|nr:MULTISPECIES: outer membrane protein assembly factor BamB [unclassified Polynucleobacter]MBU3638956.1 outer membrane protein assembly factor BamB [Polynucleobacter sp. AP-RePozz3-80-G7]QWD82300.1 outer membrane protein assembly factor BamB [Polynucleobacter sp. MWH-S4W17]
MTKEIKRLPMCLGAALVLGAVVIALAACSGSSRVRKPADLVTVTNQFDLQPVWSTSIGSSESFNFHPIVAGDAVYAASHGGNLAKIDLATGNKVWSVSVPENLSVGPGSDGRTTVAVTTKGVVYAYDDTGKPMWNVSVGSEVLSEPVVAGGVVVVRALDNRFIGLDALTGAKKWTYQRQQAALSLRVGYGMLAIGNEVIVTGFTGGRFGMIAIANGGLVWETPVSFPKGFSEIERLNDVTAKPSMEGDILCAVSYQGRIGCGQARTGNLLWFKDYSSYTGTSQSTDMVFSANDKSYVTAFATKDGTQVWENTQLTFRDVGESLAVGRVLLMGDAQGYIHAFSQANGEMVARIRHDSSPISAAPIAVGGLILVQSQGGKIAAYSPK